MLNQGIGPYFRFAIIGRPGTMSPSRNDGLDEGIAVGVKDNVIAHLYLYVAVHDKRFVRYLPTAGSLTS